MIKEEKINEKIAYKRVNDNLSLLDSKSKTIKSIYEVTFSHPNFTFLNTIHCDEITSITYEEADKEIKKFASYFVLNISSEEKYIGLLLENSKEWIYSFYGLLMAGFNPVLLSTKNGNNYVKLICQKLKIKTIITNLNFELQDTKFIDPFDALMHKVQTFNEFNNWADEILFTSSGTTGDYKIVSYNGESLYEQIKIGANIVRNNPDIRSSYKGYLKHLIILPLFHVFGLIAVFIWFSFFNVTFILPRNMNPATIRNSCIIGKPTHIFAVPLFWETLTDEIKQTVKNRNLEKKFNKGLTISTKLQNRYPNFGLKIVRNILFKSTLKQILGPSVKFCINGGARLNDESYKIINALGYKLVNGYGSTEIGITSFCNSNTLSNRLSQSIGMPFNGIYYSLVKTYNNSSELLVKTSSGAHKIYENNEWKIIDQNIYIHTNDFCELKDNGYYLIGRNDEIIVKNNGENYSLVELEQYIHSKIADAKLVIYDKNSDSFILLLSYSNKINKTIMMKELYKIYQECKEHGIEQIYYSQDYKFSFVNEIKPMRNQITKYFFLNKSRFIKFDNSQKIKEKNINIDVLERVIEIFRDITHQDNVKASSNFSIDLGGNSLKYCALIARIEEEYSVTLPLSNPMPSTPEEITKIILKMVNL